MFLSFVTVCETPIEMGDADNRVNSETTYKVLPNSHSKQTEK